MTQQTFIKALDGIASYREDSLFSTWLFQIAKRTLLDEHRRIQRRPKETKLDSLQTEIAEGYTEQTAAHRAKSGSVTAAFLTPPPTSRSKADAVGVFSQV